MGYSLRYSLERAKNKLLHTYWEQIELHSDDELKYTPFEWLPFAFLRKEKKNLNVSKTTSTPSVCLPLRDPMGATNCKCKGHNPMNLHTHHHTTSTVLV